MMKAYVKYSWYSDFERCFDKEEIEWFATIEEAQERAEFLKKQNGGYIKILKVQEGNYAEYERMLRLEKELKELREIF